MSRRALLSLCLLLAACAAEDTDVLDVQPGVEPLADGKADSAQRMTELKVTVRSDQVPMALARFKLTDDKAEQRTIYFYDTAALDLFAEGLILRARKVKDRDDDSTVKLRPLRAADVSRRWLSLPGWKCEVDRTGSRSVESCSLTTVQDTGEIDDVAAGQRALVKLFSSEQELFASTYSETPPDWSRLEVLGPIPAQAWRVSVRGLGPRLSAERWTLPDGRVLLELSTKVPEADADATQAVLVGLLASRGLDTSTQQETKTRLALESYAGR
jgi:hypothetical protein